MCQSGWKLSLKSVEISFATYRKSYLFLWCEDQLIITESATQSSFNLNLKVSLHVNKQSVFFYLNFWLCPSFDTFPSYIVYFILPRQRKKDKISSGLVDKIVDLGSALPGLETQALLMLPQPNTNRVMVSASWGITARYPGYALPNTIKHWPHMMPYHLFHYIL